MKTRVFIIICAFAVFGVAFNIPQGSEHSDDLKFVNYPVFDKGEKLEYIVHYGVINAGIATVEINRETYKVNGQNATKVTGIGRSIGAFDWFFKVRDSYITYMDKESLSPIRFVRHVDEGGFKFDQEYNFHHQEKIVVTEKNDTVPVPTGIQDLVSAYYYARSIDFEQYKPGDVVSFRAFVDGKVEPIRIRYMGKEQVSIRSGKYRCYKFQPVVQQGRVFKDPDDVTAYISDDKNKIPVLIEARVIVGSVKLELTSTKNVKYPLAKL